MRRTDFVYNKIEAYVLLEIERERDDFGVRFVDRQSVGQHIFVAQLSGMICVERIDKAVHEFQFWTQLEEGKVEVAANADRCEHVVALESDIIVIATAQIEHWRQSANEIGSVIVESRSVEDEFAGCSDVNGFHVLALLDWIACTVGLGKVVEFDVTVAEVHGWRETELEILIDTKFSQHTNGESCIPAILVGCDNALVGCSVFVGDGDRTRVH